MKISITPKDKIISIRLSANMLAELESLASTRNLTASGLVYQLMEAYLLSERNFGSDSEMLELAQARKKIAKGLLESAKRAKAIYEQDEKLHQLLMERIESVERIGSRIGKLAKA
jgi:predicted DNA-binding ribbon-helix-helix protein